MYPILDLNGPKKQMEGYIMKNTFYRVEHVDIQEMESIVSKMCDDLQEISSGTLTSQEAIEYARKLVHDAEPLERKPELVAWGVGDPYKMPGDVRIDFFYMPTYLAVSILVNVFLNYPQEVASIDNYEDILKRGLLTSIGRKFRGHGYGSLEGLIDCMEVFVEARIFEFVQKYPDFCSEFSSLIREVLRGLEIYLEKKSLKNAWGTDYSDRVLAILPKMQRQYFKKRVFVYGTLLRGNSNHRSYLKSSKFLGEAILYGYSLYDLGGFPGIKRRRGDSVKGELFEVDSEVLERLNCLESEGSLYSLETVRVEVQGRTISNVFVYVYLLSVDENSRIEMVKQPWRL